MTLEEIDSINCHPTGVQHLCSKYGYIEKKETHLEIYELPHWDFRLERTEGKYYNYIYKIIYLEHSQQRVRYAMLWHIALGIESNSGKHYIIEANGNPSHLFRLEVRVNGDTLREYFQHLGIEYNPMPLCNEDFLWRLFLDFSNRVLRFQTVKGKQTLDVLDIVA